MVPTALVRNIICVLIARWQKNYMEMKRTVIGGLSINWKKCIMDIIIVL